MTDRPIHLPPHLTAGTVYTRSFASGSLGADKLGQIVVVDTADVDCFGTIGLAVREQSGADYEL